MGRGGEAIGAARAFDVRGRRFLQALIAPSTLAFLFGALATGLTAGTQGAYFPTSWGWSAAGFGWVAAVAAIVRTRVSIGRLELAFLGGLGAYLVWVALSLIWTADFPQTVLEVQRDLVYVLAVGALLLLLERESVAALVGGIFTGIVVIAVFALATRLLPDRLGGFDPGNPIAVYRLDRPLGYWNAVAIFTSLGILLAVGFVVRGRATWVRIGAAIVLVPLLPTLYFTFGRGAWLGLGLGLAVMLAFERDRLRLVALVLAVAPAPAVALVLASRYRGLTAKGALLPEATRDGHRFLLWVVLLMAVSAVGTAVAVRLESRVRLDRRGRLAASAALWLALVGVLIGVFAAYGSPVTLARKGYDAFRAPPPAVNPGQSYNARLFNFSGNGRVGQWRVAWENYENHPVVGSGAGTFEQYWLANRTTTLKVRDAHSLYVEALSELGPPGLLVIVSAFLVPFAGAFRGRRHALVPTAIGAYAAFVFHAGIDWDWEMLGVTVPGLFLGVAVLVAGAEAHRSLTPSLRGAALVGTLALAGFGLVGLLASVPLDKAADANVSDRYAAAVREANRSIRWAPWSTEAWQQKGRAQRGLDRPGAARASFLRALENDRLDWSVWYDLGTVSTGRAATCAYVEAARLNPLSRDVAVLRQRGFLPKKPAADARLRCVPAETIRG